MPDGGPSLWARLPAGDADTFAQVALRHGVEIVPGSAMSPDGAHLDHLRLPFTFDPDEMVVVVQRLAAAWATYAPARAVAPAPLSLVV